MRKANKNLKQSIDMKYEWEHINQELLRIKIKQFKKRRELNYH